MILKMCIQLGKQAKWDNGNRALIYCHMQYLYALNIFSFSHYHHPGKYILFSQFYK